MTNRQTIVALLSILALGLGLRVWGIGWGMPYAFHPDEDNYLPGAITMLFKGDLNPHYFRNPPLLTYTVLLELLLYLQVGRVLGFPQTIDDIGLQMLQNPAPLYILARMTSAVLGTGTVLVVYLIGKRLFGVGTGLFGALLLAVAFLHVRDSHYVVNDVAAAFLLMGSFFFSCRVFARGRYRDYLLAGALLGLAVATKYNAGIGVVPLVAAHLLRPKGLAARGHLPLLAAGLASLLAFLAANPYSLLDFSTFRQQFAGQYGWTSDPYGTSDAPVGQVILRSLAVGTSPVILGASLLGLAWMLIRQPREALLLAAFPVAYLAFFLMESNLFYARFAIPVIPFIALLASYATARLISIAGRGPGRTLAGLAVAALLVLPPLALDVKHDSLLRTEDTRLLLGRWIESNVPPGSKMAVEGYSFVDFWGRRLGPKKIEYQLQVVPSLRVQALDYYRQEGFDYLVASSYVYRRYDLNPTAHAGEIEWYREMDRELPLAASFHPTDDGRELPFLMDEELTPLYTVLERDRPGPTLKVYQVGPAPKYGVGWLGVAVPGEMPAGQRIALPVTVRNTGDLPWPSQGYTPVRIAHRWLDASSGEVVGSEPRRSLLPTDVRPGQEVRVAVELLAPAVPGVYILRLDLVQENFAWLSSKGAEALEVRVTVR